MLRLIKILINVLFVISNQGETGTEDCQQALASLFTVLFTMVRVMAPYTPFLTELMYQNLRLLTQRQEKSVHFVMMPQPRFEPLVALLLQQHIASTIAWLLRKLKLIQLVTTRT